MTYITSYNVSLLVVNSFIFCMSESVFISPHIHFWEPYLWVWGFMLSVHCSQHFKDVASLFYSGWSSTWLKTNYSPFLGQTSLSALLNAWLNHIVFLLGWWEQLLFLTLCECWQFPLIPVDEAFTSPKWFLHIYAPLPPTLLKGSSGPTTLPLCS